MVLRGSGVTGEKGEGEMSELSSSEAIYGFAAWLTCRDEVVVFSARNDAAIVADLVDEFCKVNKLPEPREGWHNRLIHPPNKRV